MDKLQMIIAGMKEDLIRDLCRWVSIPSVKAEASTGAPFGPEIRKMLDTALADAKAMGFETRDFDGYAGDVRMGPTGTNPLAVLAHLDVVPAGDGWHSDPFEAKIHDNFIYARGTEDDKGPALEALYAMAAIQKAGFPLKREVRMILGCDEECGWGCMDYYSAHCDMPKTGFSPDAAYPVINTEKGTLQLALQGKYNDEGLPVLEIWVGDRTNVIPGIATATIAGDEALCNKINNQAAETGAKVSAEISKPGVILVTSTGIPGHAAMPECALNALGQLLCVLDPLGLTGGLHQLAKVVGLEYDGSSLTIDCSDGVSGKLTCNMGILHYNKENGLYATLDIRYPILANHEAIIAAAQAALTNLFTIDIIHHMVPHHVAPNSALVTGLLDAYHQVTGLPKQCIAIGGGTYAKVLEEGVAFGGVFPNEEERAHQADERVDIDSMMKNVEIYARAILNLQDA